MLSSIRREGQRRREVHAPQLLNAARAQLALDNLVAHEREDPAADEERPRVAIPVDARDAAVVVARAATRVEGTDLAQVELIVFQIEERSGFEPQLARGGL